jgi:nicotinate-nucleotide adenylyltransferase
MTAPPLRIGVFGGTFDPPHIGHLAVAAECRGALRLDRMLLVVAGEPWQKVDDRRISPADVRLDLTAAAVAPYPGLEVSDIEVRRSGPSYTADTLGELSKLHPGAELFVVLGADAARGLPTWERVDEVIDGATLVVCARDGGFGELPDGVHWRRITVPRIDVSSTDIRERVAAGRSIEVLVPPGATLSIGRHSLYRDPR